METSHPISTDDVHLLTAEQLLKAFLSLPCPSMDEMHGEYSAELLRQPSFVATTLSHLSLSCPLMPWQCKAFRPTDEAHGRGYNTFHLLGKVVQCAPMGTLIAPSRYDGKPAYQLVYRAYRSFFGELHMVDEVRRIAAGRYLGIGTWGFTDSQRQVALPFLLVGPAAPYRKDIGTERVAFTLDEEIPALRTDNK